MNIHLLWQTKVMELSLAFGIPLLEGAVGAYTSEEFERTPDSSMMEQTRAVNVSITEVQTHIWSRGGLRLLPGRKWLLHNIDDCIYMIADLDAPELTWCMSVLLMNDNTASTAGWWALS